MTHRKAFWALIALLVAFWAPTIVGGGVLFPHDNSIELGASRRGVSEWVTNRKFSDLSSCYVPELGAQLGGSSSSWLSTWNPHVGLGRPSPHTFGFTKAFPITHVISFFTSDPFVAYTVLAILTMILTGIFTFRFLESLDLHEWACFAGAAGLATGVFLSYWISFVMFTASVCWTVCLLWLVTRFAKRPSFGSAAGLAFATYALLLTGYPQQVVFYVYLLATYALTAIWREGKLRWGRGLGIVASGAFGAAMTWPVFADLLQGARLSTRFQYEASYFLQALPAVENVGDLFFHISQLLDAFWIGNPIRPEYPRPFSGFSLTPAFAILSLWAVVGRTRKRVWFWSAWLGVLAIAAFIPGVYAFAVEYLGFGISRNPPSRVALIPFAVLCAFASDRVLRRPEPLHAPALIAGALPFVLVAIVQLPEAGEFPIAPAALALFLTLGAMAFGVVRHPAILVVLVVASAFAYGRRVILARDQASIHVTSPLVEAIRERTRDGSRYAVVGARIMPSNQESLLDLRSIHTYDTLCSKAYQELVLELSEEGMTNYGRHFMTISSSRKLRDPAFSYAGIGFVVSNQALPDVAFEPVGSFYDLKYYAPRREPILEAQLSVFDVDSEGAVQLSGFLHDQPSEEVVRETDQGDFLTFRTTPSDERTLLFVSQQFHGRWVATAQREELETVRINGFYQGVLLPPGTDEVVLEFRPEVLSSWAPQVVFLLLGAMGALRWGFDRIRRPDPSCERPGGRDH